MVLHNAHVVKYLEYEIAWYDGTLDADFWAALSEITLTEAAMLLCRFEPREQSYNDAKQMSTGNMKIDNEPKRLQNLKRGLVDVEREDPRPRTLRDWHQAARAKGLAYHPWIDHYMEGTAPPVQPAPVEETVSPAPVVPDSASNAPAIDPPPVATRTIAFAFDGLRGWNEKAWKDTLGSPPKWLEACIVLRGHRGTRETHWNPVLIGAALVRAGHAKPNNIRARFQTRRLLEDWKDAWKTYEADNFDTQ